MGRARQPARERSLRSRSAREYESMVRALQRLERTLGQPAVRRERAWRRETRRDLAVVLGLLQEHGEAAEAPGGLLVEAERRVGRSRNVSQARREHALLMRQAATLLADLDEYAPPAALPYQEFRKRAVRLAGGLRLHHARVADILMETFQLDLGGGD